MLVANLSQVCLCIYGSDILGSKQRHVHKHEEWQTRNTNLHSQLPIMCGLLWACRFRDEPPSQPYMGFAY